ncbi:cation channel family protein (macronuclear) [Tetrahymena thermophila SB210]|uniref:Cation channel family protein n=1 Tax=Tetrahymena thermophila (strain SB210) TaxID=312017 RepID=I7M8Y8_TETTS|nr:cation channel family protein [Tetrahymena thermophila SB210]EAS00305.2 cation channel family protein [Tetrahymena thermophila SB210]|eukprot:XP_001020550.2 cation channel family protein [Tetrahymena thermophila SB210]
MISKEGVDKVKQPENKKIKTQQSEELKSVLPQVFQNIKNQPLIQVRKLKPQENVINELSNNQANNKQNPPQKQSVLANFMIKNRASQIITCQNSEQLKNLDASDQQEKYFTDFFHMMRIKLRLRQIISKTESRRQKELNETHFSLIQDKASQCKIYDKNIQTYNRSYTQRMKAKQKKIINKIFKTPTFNPASHVLLLWDLFQFIQYFTLGISISLKLSFASTMQQIIPDYIFQSIIISFTLDIFVKLNTGFYSQGNYKFEKSLIFKNYVKKYMIKDFLTIFSLGVYYFISDKVSNEYTSPYNFIPVIGFIFKLSQIVKIFNKIEEYINNKLKTTHFTNLFKLLFNMLLVGHLFSCVWISIAKIVPIYVDNQLPTWLTIKQGVESSWKIEYLYAFYYSSVTMITVGYGDITPQNSYEVLLCLFTLFIACCVFAYTVNSIGYIINEIQQKNTLNKQKSNIIFNYMKQKNISRDLQYEVQQYLKYIWKGTDERNTEQEENIIEMLNSNLRQRLQIEANKLVLSDTPIFKNNFSDIVLERTVSIIKEKRYYPEEIIFRQNDTGDSNIYFIASGQVQIYIEASYPGGEKKVQILQSLQSGQSFGHYSFFTGQPRMVNVRTQGFVTLLSINRNSFINLLQEYQEDYEQFCEIREEVLYQSMYHKIGLSCYSCGKADHLVNKCRVVHHEAQIEYIIAQENFIQLKRQTHERFYKHKFRSLADLQILNNSQYQYFQQNNELMVIYTEVFLNINSNLYSESSISEQSSHSDSSNTDSVESNESKTSLLKEKTKKTVRQNSDQNLDKIKEENQRKLSLLQLTSFENMKEVQFIEELENSSDMNKQETQIQRNKRSTLQNYQSEQQGTHNHIISSTCIDQNEESDTQKDKNINAIKLKQNVLSKLNNTSQISLSDQQSQLSQTQNVNHQARWSIPKSLSIINDKMSESRKSKILSHVQQKELIQNLINSQEDNFLKLNSNIKLQNENEIIKQSTRCIKGKLNANIKQVIAKNQEKKQKLLGFMQQYVSKNKQEQEIKRVSFEPKEISLSNLQTRQPIFFVNQSQNDIFDKQRNFKKYFPQWNLNFIVYKINLPPKHLKECKKNLRENAIKFQSNQNQISNFGQINFNHQQDQLDKFKQLKKNDQGNLQENQNKKGQAQNNLATQKLLYQQKLIQTQKISDQISEESFISDDQSSKNSKIQNRLSKISCYTQNQADKTIKRQSDFSRLITQNDQISKVDPQDFLIGDTFMAQNQQLHTSFNEKIESEQHISNSFSLKSNFKQKNIYQF